jgi:integrase
MNCCGAGAMGSRCGPDHDALVRRCGRRRQAVDAKSPRVTVHELRHTAASLMIASGANVKTVAPSS